MKLKDAQGINIKVDFLAKIFGRICFCVYFCGKIRNMERILLIVVTGTELLGELRFTIDDE